MVKFGLLRAEASESCATEFSYSPLATDLGSELSDFPISGFPIYEPAPLPRWRGAKPVWVQPREYKALGSSLAEVRKRAKLTQQQLARRLRKPQSFQDVNAALPPFVGRNGAQSVHLAPLVA